MSQANRAKTRTRRMQSIASSRWDERIGARLPEEVGALGPEHWIASQDLPCPPIKLPRPARLRSGGRVNPAGRRRMRGFTLIELLVVISIIGVLAGLVVGLSGTAVYKSKEARVRIELNKLANAIENYKSVMGSYPPDNPGQPSTNQLYYELSGTLYRQQGNQGFFLVPGRPELLDANSIQRVFGSSGFANAAREGSPKDLKFKEEFKAAQVKTFTATGNQPVDVLVVPGTPPPTFTYYTNSVPIPHPPGVNPWLYVSSSPINNPERYDLWAEVVIGRHVVRFSNWDKDPVVLK